MNNNEKNCFKYCRCYYFDDIIELQYFDLDNVLKDEKSHENTLIHEI